MVGEHVSFDLDVEVSLFETNIRVLGGLLLPISSPATLRGAEHLAVSGYKGELLRLAVDLASVYYPRLTAARSCRVPSSA